MCRSQQKRLHLLHFLAGVVKSDERKREFFSSGMRIMLLVDLGHDARVEMFAMSSRFTTCCDAKGLRVGRSSCSNPSGKLFFALRGRDVDPWER